MPADTTELRRWVLARPRSGEDTALAAALAAHGTPLLTDDPDDADRQRVLLTFLAPPETAGVYAWINRITDGRNDELGHLRRRGTGRLWFTELSLPRTTLAGYRFYPFTADDPAARDGFVRYDRTLAGKAVDDPSFGVPDSPFGSVIAGSRAPDLGRWRPAARRAHRIAATGTLGAPAAVRWRLTEPIGTSPHPLRLVVLFDAQTWFDRCDLPGVLAADPPSAPVALLGIDSPLRPAERIRLLGADRDFLSAVAALTAAARARLGAAHAPVTWAGQSLGGLSALAAACWFPEAVDEVLVYSPSLWWRPGCTTRPTDPGPGPGWIAGSLSAATARPVTLAVGANERLLTGPVAALAQQLQARDWPVRMHRYPGGHDLPWWAHLLRQDLRAAPAPFTAC
ncbi:putative siderophore esterase [Gordonia hirsuta DSM 44140 = NBRC 16056]|uniref:Putative siderophore esterase n=1 Tax=Gordonia hirsuta DSM 44140 = NBRC 16056 TaxID=1121927 RepID=L7L991_9ACTN|nr:alpha/beta hydrolase-fold protein [Gordonia hirsuta]GAC56617.1 putative siderophore esterase [Gordonia hirsuta DSM 44140 = NBRC 16056]